MKEPVDHILRPTLPWRGDEGMITECGYDATKVNTLTRAEYFQRVTDFGKQRAAMLTCMTCASTAQRWGTWDDDPRLALEREIQWERGWSRENRGQRLKDELLAIAVLIDEHHEAFEAIITENVQRREWIEKKAAAKAKPAPKRTGPRSL